MDAAEAEKYVCDMVASGAISATIDQPQGMVQFSERQARTPPLALTLTRPHHALTPPTRYTAYAPRCTLRLRACHASPCARAVRRLPSSSWASVGMTSIQLQRSVLSPMTKEPPI